MGIDSVNENPLGALGLTKAARNALAAEVSNDEAKLAKEALKNTMYLSETEGKDDKLFAFMNNPFADLKNEIPKKTA